MPERVVVLSKTTQLPIINKRGEKYGHKVGLFMLAIEEFSSKVVNATQLLVERNLEDILCHVDIYNPQPSLEVHQNNDAGISESPDSRLRKS